MRKVAVNTLIIALSLVITLLVLELGARFWLWNIALDSQFNEYASLNQLNARYGGDFLLTEGSAAPHRHIGYIPRPDYVDGPNRHNSQGYRGDEIVLPKPDDVFRIVTLGGSTTYSTGVDDPALSYPALLQAELHNAGFSQVDVVNGGMIGYASLESLLNLQMRVLSVEPDMIIVYHGINDVHPRLVWPPDAYRADYSGSQTLRLQSVRLPQWWEYSTLLRGVGVRLGWTQPHSRLDWSLKERPDTYYATRFEQQVIRGIYPADIFQDVSAMTMLETNTPVYFESNFRSMATIAQANDIVPVFLSFAYSPLFAGHARVTSAEYQFAYEEQNAVIEALADEMGVPFFDLEAVMPDDRQYYTDGRHFTEAGNRRRAALIADFLIEAGLIPDDDPQAVATGGR